jgi:hypothetical protein
VSKSRQPINPEQQVASVDPHHLKKKEIVYHKTSDGAQQLLPQHHLRLLSTASQWSSHI